MLTTKGYETINSRIGRNNENCLKGHVNTLLSLIHVYFHGFSYTERSFSGPRFRQEWLDCWELSRRGIVAVKATLRRREMEEEEGKPSVRANFK